MDPNASKKELINKLSKSQALARLYEEPFKRRTISFYRYINLNEPYKLRDKLN